MRILQPAEGPAHLKRIRSGKVNQPERAGVHPGQLNRALREKLFPLARSSDSRRASWEVQIELKDFDSGGFVAGPKPGNVESTAGNPGGFLLTECLDWPGPGWAR